MPDPRWFTEAELAEMARPTMDVLQDALAAGDLPAADGLAERMKTEWGMLHDLLVEMIAGLATYVHEREGDAGVARAWEATFERSWRHHVERTAELDPRVVVELLARTWRAHSISGTGKSPASFSVSEDDEKFTFRMSPCGSGQRLVIRGRYEGERAYARTTEAHSWTYGQADFPIYCTHCSFMNEILPLRWIGRVLYPSEPPKDFNTDPCVWYWYKDPSSTPDRFAERYVDDPELRAPD